VRDKINVILEKESEMVIVHVFIEVKPKFHDDFIVATLANVRGSCQEPGIARFDFLQSEENSHSFVLNEVYRTKDAITRHKETPHYQIWAETVKEMLVVPRTKKIYANIYPEDERWGD